MDEYGTEPVLADHCREDAMRSLPDAEIDPADLDLRLNNAYLAYDNAYLAYATSLRIVAMGLLSKRFALGQRGRRSSVEAPPFRSTADARAAELLERVDLSGASLTPRPRLNRLAADEFRRPPEPAPVVRRSRLSLRQLEPWQFVLRILVRLLRKYLPGLAEPRWADTRAETCTHDGIDASTGHLSIRAPGARGTYPPPPARSRTPGDSPCRPTAPRTSPLPTPT